MNPFGHITDLILEKLRNEGIYRYTIDEVRNIIEERNFLLDLFQLDWLNWDLLDSDKKRKYKKNEEEYRENMYLSLTDACKAIGFNVTYEDLEKIFRLEKDIVPHIRVNYYEESYYDIELNRSIPFTEMDFKKKFRIYKWMNWKNTIDRAIMKYYREFGILPNVLFANKHTLSQFNFLINSIPGEKDDVFRYDEATMLKIPVDDEEEIVLSGYEAGECRLYFWFDQTMKDKIFILDYDDDINWDDDNDDDDNDDDDKNPIAPAPKETIGIRK